LAVRHFQTRQLLDAEQKFRDDGYIPDVAVDYKTSVPAYDGYPVCFVRRIRLDQKIGNPNNADARMRVVQSTTCEQHTPWLQGFTPREHREMIQEEARLKWQAEREAADRADRDRRDQDARRFQEDQADRATRHENRSLGVAIIAVIVAVVGPILAAILTPPPTVINQFQLPPSATTPNTALSLPQINPQTTTADQSLPPSSPE
jgi:hypothetical protein